MALGRSSVPPTPAGANTRSRPPALCQGGGWSIELDLLSESELEPAVLARGEIAFGRCVGGGEVRD